MKLITQGKTNWQYILIVAVLAAIVGGGILWCSRQRTTPYQLPKDDCGRCLEENPHCFSCCDYVCGHVDDETADWKTYRNEEYGFEIALLNSWEGYSVLVESWNGVTLDGKSTRFQGPEIIIRNPKWTEDTPWQDIPIMVFTKEEWELVEERNLNVSAAPIGPSKLAENQKYVFALPPRWVGYYDTLGQDEAEKIVETFRAF